MGFDYKLDFKRTDFRARPDLCRVAPAEPDASKLASAKVFRERLDAVLKDPAYVRMRDEHKRLYETPPPRVR